MGNLQTQGNWSKKFIRDIVVHVTFCQTVSLSFIMWEKYEFPNRNNTINNLIFPFHKSADCGLLGVTLSYTLFTFPNRWYGITIKSCFSRYWYTEAQTSDFSLEGNFQFIKGREVSQSHSDYATCARGQHPKKCNFTLPSIFHHKKE